MAEKNTKHQFEKSDFFRKTPKERIKEIRKWEESVWDIQELHYKYNYHEPSFGTLEEKEKEE